MGNSPKKPNGANSASINNVRGTIAALPKKEPVPLTEKQLERIERKRKIDAVIATAPADIRDAIQANLYLMEDEYWFLPEYLYYSHPCLDANLKPNEMYVGYKIARFRLGYEVSMEVAVAVKLYIPSYANSIRLGHDGSRVHPPVDGLDKRRKYCTGKAIVAAVSFFGNPSYVNDHQNSFKSGVGAIVSNHDINFEYKLQHEIVEPAFGKKGIGCVQGIHFFASLNSALAYGSSSGYIPKFTYCPEITAETFAKRDIDEIEVEGPTATEQKDLEQLIVENTNRPYSTPMDLETVAMLSNNPTPAAREVVKQLFGKNYFKHLKK